MRKRFGEKSGGFSQSFPPVDLFLFSHCLSFEVTHFRSRPYRLVHLLFHSTRLFFSYGVWSGLSVLGDEIFAFYTLLRLHRGVPVMAQFIGLSFFFLNISLLSSSLIVDIDLSSSLHCFTRW